MHRVMVDQILWTTGDIASITGDEAHHALRVKRVRGGEPIELMDGRGTIAAGEVLESERPGKDRELRVRINSIRHEAPPSPRVEVWSAVPKGGRVDDMIDQLAQIGAAEWRPLDTARSVVDPREAKMERLCRIAAESSKQCGRAWTMAIGSKSTFTEAVQPAPDTLIVLADASGTPINAAATHTNIRLLIGPEGGWSEQEMHTARAASVRIARFGPHVMRIETAAIASCATIMGASAST